MPKDLSSSGNSSVNVLNQIPKKNKKKTELLKYIRKNWILYLFLSPAVLSVLIFNYIPMYGVVIAFKDFSPVRGIMASEWVGFSHFTNFMQSPNFLRIFMNTVQLSAYELLIGFPIPIILALMLNQVRRSGIKKNIQLIIYAPHFISVVVIGGMIFMFLSPAGPLNAILTVFLDRPVAFMSEPNYFRTIFVASGIWQAAGFASIIYVAALSNSDPQLHDAAMIDGASLLQRIWHIDVQVLKPVMAVLFILAVGGIMAVGFEKAYLLQTDMNLPASEVIETYVYKRGLQAADWSFGAAVGLFLSIINLMLLITVNQVVKKLKGESLF
ncbi:ABC transporter permease [Salipaludibacillus neizhouensis]|uniref:ABC transporter permease n=1 Tax=Salipaludibacillus neizhouensis TaxID=885475 RepID=A0A3A9KBP9_9BACI|nr:ABC transporter permease subunit [Salipaludibacillus neizhouensis]RKL67023.1 ABC transporter permease [Salipaludibacillus neizhouensis]